MPIGRFPSDKGDVAGLAFAPQRRVIRAVSVAKQGGDDVPNVFPFETN